MNTTQATPESAPAESRALSPREIEFLARVNELAAIGYGRMIELICYRFYLAAPETARDAILKALLAGEEQARGVASKQLRDPTILFGPGRPSTARPFGRFTVVDKMPGPASPTEPDAKQAKQDFDTLPPQHDPDFGA